MVLWVSAETQPGGIMSILTVLRTLIVMHTNKLYILLISVKIWTWDAVTVEKQDLLM